LLRHALAVQEKVAEPDYHLTVAVMNTLGNLLEGQRDFEQAENRELSPLADLQPGARAEIVRLAEHDGDLLHWFYDQGFVPGASVEVQETQPAAEQLTVRLNGGEQTIAEKAAAGLFVRPS